MATIEELGDRRTRVLRAVVRDYIRTGEPVGSSTIARRYRLGVSPATIRNDMAALEELGFLTQPHTSAGRIPTDLGYRFYVDTLASLPELSPNQREAIASALDQRASDIEELMRRTANVLAGMTRYAAVALPPVVEATGMVRVDLVPVANGALLLTVWDTGRVGKRLVPVPPDREGAIPRVAQLLATGFEGLTHAKAAERVRGMIPGAAEDDRALLGEVAEAFADLDRDQDEEHLYIGGVANIAGEDAFEHRATLRRLFEALDEEATILRLLHRLTSEDEGDIAVRIGHENPVAAMRETSVVVARYRIGEDATGTVAVIGPTRMEYPAAMSTTRAVARRLSDVVHRLGG